MYVWLRSVGGVCHGSSTSRWWRVVPGTARATALLLCHTAPLLCHRTPLLCHTTPLLCHTAPLLCHTAGRSYTTLVCGVRRVVHSVGVHRVVGVVLRRLSVGVLRLDKPGTEGARASFNSAKTRSTLYYVAAIWVLAFGLSYAAVPLYRIFCQAYSYGGTVQEGQVGDKVESMQKVDDRVIKVRFNADTAASMTWNFKPQQTEIKVHPGETALAFYTARNPTECPVIGISTYNVIPFDAGQYFNKIQCFCFEEQLLNPHEEVHMPVFFYIDPEFAEDPKMQNVDTLTLSYTFFEAREGLQIPVPKFAR